MFIFINIYYLVGDVCEIEINECTATPSSCQHDSNCTNTVGSYECNCSLGYHGMNCENARCMEDRCENGGTCTVIIDVTGLPGSTRWHCVCAQYYEGMWRKWGVVKGEGMR